MSRTTSVLSILQVNETQRFVIAIIQHHTNSTASASFIRTSGSLQCQWVS